MWQQLLWECPTFFGRIWWLVCACFAGPACILILAYMVHNQKWGALLISRLLVMVGLLCFSVTWLNSGFLPWGVLLVSIGGCMSSAMIATDWCNRPDQSTTLLGDGLRWIVHFFCGPRSQWRREDLI